MSGPTHHPRAWAAIDLLRFGCALLVIAYHYGAGLPLNPNAAAAAMQAGAPLDARWATWTGFGWVGVELFFVISGYVIACSAVGAAPRDFLRRRAQRLLPAAWVCATLTLVVLAAMGAESWAGLGAAWLRSVSFWPLGEAIDPSYWTLGIEAAFYLLVAWRLRGGSSAERVGRIGWWIGGASMAFWIALIALGSVDGTWMEERLVQLLLLPHGGFFAIGILLHGWHRSGMSVTRLAGLALLAATGAVEIVAHGAHQGHILGIDVSPVPPITAFALGLAIVAGCRRIQPRLHRACGWSATLGLMTYPLYLLHQQIGAAVAAQVGPGGLWLALALVTGLAWLVVRFAEPPLRRWIGAVSARHDPRRDIPPTASPSGG